MACLLGNTVFHKTKTAMGRPLTTTLAGVFFGNMFLSCAVVLVVVYGLLLAVGLQWAVWPLIAAYAVRVPHTRHGDADICGVPSQRSLGRYFAVFLSNP